MKKRKFTALLLLLTSLCALTGLQGFSKNTKASKKQATEQDKQYAQCLKEKGITMYGAEWCPHCKDQKNEFGELFSYVNYIDCDKNPKACKENHVTGYPTWLLPNGKEIEAGSIAEVAQASGCSLAQENTTDSASPISNTEDATDGSDVNNMSTSENNSSTNQNNSTTTTEAVTTDTNSNSQAASATNKETITQPAKNKKPSATKKKVKNIKTNKQTTQTNTSNQ